AIFGVWLANIVSTIAISLIVGTRQPEHLFLPNLYIFLLLAALILMDMFRVYSRVPKALVGVTALAAFGFLAFGTFDALRQALAKPIAEDLAVFLSEEYPTARIQSGLELPVPQTVEAQQMTFARWDRLAEKYDVTMPDIAPERILTEDPDGALFWKDLPLVMSGLEGDSVQDAEYEVQPHAWPVQPEEWRLDTWLDKGFTVFIVNNLEFLIAESLSTNIREYHEELAARCAVAKVYPARKPMYLEKDITVFDCGTA
ncbi:MAG TPA: hypothetical protein VJ928_07855, partial [Marivita sp.]|nr:hypothetical protein [Marivita sp.]